MTKPFCLISCLIFVSLLATAAHAQAPAWHVGTFEMPVTPPGCGGVNFCGAAAQTAMDREVLHPKMDGKFLVHGQNADTSVVVSCVAISSKKMWATVFAASPHSASAERLRNAIRQSMLGERCL